MSDGVGVWDVVVAGGGVTGLACAVELARAGRHVLVIDARQELGTPVRRPGWLRDAGAWWPWLVGRGLSPAAHAASRRDEAMVPAGVVLGAGDRGEQGHGEQGQDELVHTGPMAMRREWVEKSLATELARSGGDVWTKTRVSGAARVDGMWQVAHAGAGPTPRLKVRSAWLVDALGCQPSAAGWPGDADILHQSTDEEVGLKEGFVARPPSDPQVRWSGGVALAPPEDAHWAPALDGAQSVWHSELAVTDGRLALERADGTWACWAWREVDVQRDDPGRTDGVVEVDELGPAPRGGWLERMYGWSSEVGCAAIDSSLARGLEVANRILTAL